MLEQPILVKMTTWFYTLLPSIFGSLISLKFSTENMTFGNRFLSVLSGIIISHYFTHTVIEAFNVKPDSFLVSGLLFVSGLFGFAVMAEIYKQLPQIISSVFQRIVNLLK